MGMCMQCAFEGSKAAASAGGAAGVPGVLAAASAALGLRKLRNWLALRGYRVLSAMRLKIATGVVVWVFVLAFYGVRF
jgi:hypothetical protein